MEVASLAAPARADARDDAKVSEALKRLPKHSFLSIAEVESVGRDIARRLLCKGVNPDLVVGIANGALLMTQVVSEELGRPFEIVNVRRKGSRIKYRLVRLKQALRVPYVTRGPMVLFWRAFERAFYKYWPTQLEAESNELQFDVRGKNVLLVDDCIATGASVRFVHSQLLAGGARTVTVGAICLYDHSALRPGNIGFPAVYISRVSHFYPWSAIHPDYEQYLLWLTAHNLKQWE
jgi:hypoxanthine phosphoribosyltransferase